MKLQRHLEEIKKASVPDAKNHDFANEGFTYRRAYFEDFDGQYYEITLSVGHNGTVATVYNVGKIEKSVLPSAKIIAGAGSKALGKTLSKGIISSSKDNVNIKPVKGKVTVASGVKLSKGEKAILSKIAKDSGVAVVVERFSGADAASKGFYSGGVVHLNADRLSEGGFTYTGIHEVVHHLRVVNTEGYKAIESFAKNYYKEKGADLDSEVAKTQAYYKSKGVELTPEEAMEEIVCNTLSDIATDEDALSAFLGLDSKSQNKFIEVIKTLVRKLKEWANKFLKNTEYHSIVMNDADTLLSLAKQLRAELTKSGQKNNTAENSGVKYGVYFTFGNNENITYDSLIAKDDMLISEVKTSFVDIENLKREDIVKKAVENLSHKKDSRGVIQIHNADTNKDIAVGVRGLSHGLERNFEYTAMVTLNLESYLENAIKINEALADENRNHDSDILLGYGETVTGEKIPAYFVVSKLVTGLDELVEFGSLYSIKAKKIAEDSTQGSPGVQSRTSATISISELLDIVNESYSDILPRSVAEHYGIEKRKTKLGKSVKFSLSHETDAEYLSAVESEDYDTARRLVGEAAEKAMKNSEIRDESGKLAKVYHGSESDDFYEFDKVRRGQTDTVSGKEYIKRRSFETANIIIIAYRDWVCQRNTLQ